MIVEFFREAVSDLEKISDYIAQDNPRRADSFVNEIRIKCKALVHSPNGFPLVARYEEYGIRRRMHGSYVIFYRVEEERIVILRILHGAMDYAAILFGD
ncbi:plasmid stabilization protein [Brucella endophytica]|uniref:Plasmid stabilization protein n=1 Tax=Brucella endophytica TaxID=1963359 RepID=A0A916S5L2_9HYPH|nr:type II toxin-antitoxin system RelE/ParE family toxin [Brucella endophytica]GGA85598.1 plasmid stabilization protein [Brucella endophytica]